MTTMSIYRVYLQSWRFYLYLRCSLSNLLRQHR